MRASDVVEVLDQLRGAGAAHIVAGGWGIDALLGAETRTHRDVDLLIDASDLGRAQLALAAISFFPDDSREPELPAFLMLRDARGRHVDLHLLVFDDAGNGRQHFSDRRSLDFPAGGLDGSGSIGGRSVACLSPALQLRHHVGYDRDAGDERDLRLLAERFGLTLPSQPERRGQRYADAGKSPPR